MQEELKLEPYHDRVIVKRIDLEVKSAGGIILGEMEKDREIGYGVALAVGEGKRLDTEGLIPTKTNVGDIVAFVERIPLRVSFKGAFYHTLRESDILFRVYDNDVTEKEYQTEGGEYENMIQKFN